MATQNDEVAQQIGAFFSASPVLKGRAETEQRIKRLADRFSILTGEKLEHLYITYFPKVTPLKLKDLWLFSKKYVMVVEDFEEKKFEPKKEESLQFFSVNKRISQIKVTASDYKLGVDDEWDDNSKLRLEGTISEDVPIVLERYDLISWTEQFSGVSY